MVKTKTTSLLGNSKEDSPLLQTELIISGLRPSFIHTVQESILKSSAVDGHLLEFDPLRLNDKKRRDWPCKVGIHARKSLSPERQIVVLPDALKFTLGEN